MELGTGSSHPSTSGLTVSLETPAGTYSGTATWPDAAISAYALSGNSNKSTLGLYSIAGIGAANGFAEGINAVLTNCKLFDSSCTGSTGLDFRYLQNEIDVAVYSKSGAAPSGDVYGLSILNASTIQPTGQLTGILIGSASTSPPFKVAFATNTGAATVGLSLAATSAASSSNSQAINMTAINSGGAPVLGQIYVDALGRTQTTNLGISAGLTLFGFPTSGTATGTLCVTSSNTVFIKTTSGACL